MILIKGFFYNNLLNISMFIFSGESQWSTLGDSQEMWGTNEETPLWDSNPAAWDHDSATRLAQKLLQVCILCYTNKNLKLVLQVLKIYYD